VLTHDHDAKHEGYHGPQAPDGAGHGGAFAGDDLVAAQIPGPAPAMAGSADAAEQAADESGPPCATAQLS
jgi:hypothetical protein